MSKKQTLESVLENDIMKQIKNWRLLALLAAVGVTLLITLPNQNAVAQVNGDGTIGILQILQKLEGKLDKLPNVGVLLEKLEAKLDKLGNANPVPVLAKLEAKLDRLEAKVDQNGNGNTVPILAKLEAKLDRLQPNGGQTGNPAIGLIQKLEAKLDRLEAKIDHEDGPIQKLEAKLDRLEAKVDHLINPNPNPTGAQ